MSCFCFAELQDSISTLEKQINDMYAEDSMRQVSACSRRQCCSLLTTINLPWLISVIYVEDHWLIIEFYTRRCVAVLLTLLQSAYRLHAVFVHEGQAASGHYWAYVYNTRHRKWLKYNDITVTEATWQELTSDSYGGGRNNASAYCLMYIDDNCSDLVRGKATKSIIMCEV